MVRSAGAAAGPLVGARMVIDGRDAVSVTFRCAGDGASGVYLVLNTVTDRARDHLELFRMERVGGVDPWVLSCALPADVIVSYQFVPVGPGGLDPRVADDRRAWAKLKMQGIDAPEPSPILESYVVGMSVKLPDRDIPAMWVEQLKETGIPVDISFHL